MIEKTTSRLRPQTERLLEILKPFSGDNWARRADIARGLEKRKLSSYDIALLEILQEQGVIEIMLRDNRTPIGFEFVYRLTDKAAGG